MLDPLLSQNGYRWRRDDGSETSASWAEAENTPVTISTPTGGTFRCRMLVQEVNGSNSRDQMYWVQARLNGGAWVTLTEVDQGIGFKLEPSAFVPHATPTTPQLTSGTGSFISGYEITQNPSGLTITVSGGNHTEWEYCVSLDATLYNTGDLFELRIVGDGDIPLDAYNQIAAFTLNKPIVKYFSGSATAVGQAASGQERQRNYSSSVSGVASQSSRLTWVGKLRATVTGVATALSSIGLDRFFKGSVAGIALTQAALKKVKLLSGTVSGFASVTGRIVNVVVVGTASALGVATSDALFLRTRNMTSAIIGTGITQARIVVVHKYHATITGVATASAILQTQLPTSGHINMKSFGD